MSVDDDEILRFGDGYTEFGILYFQGREIEEMWVRIDNSDIISYTIKKNNGWDCFEVFLTDEGEKALYAQVSQQDIINRMSNEMKNFWQRKIRNGE